MPRCTLHIYSPESLSRFSPLRATGTSACLTLRPTPFREKAKRDGIPHGPASIYITADPERAGHSLLTLAVKNGLVKIVAERARGRITGEFPRQGVRVPP